MRPATLAASFIVLATTAAFGQAVSKAVRLDPKHAVTYYNRGLARHKSGDVDKAIADFSQAIRFDPKHVNAYFARGVAWQNKGDFDKAIADFNQVIRFDPKQANGKVPPIIGRDQPSCQLHQSLPSDRWQCSRVSHDGEIMGGTFPAADG